VLVFDGTPLHLAAAKGHIETMQLLISNGACVNSSDKCGGKPLHLAAYQGHNNAVELLIENHAEINTQDNVIIWHFVLLSN